MKRIVECPSCKTKLQIFDVGKAIKQKCPRCKSDFDIESDKPDEKKKTESKKKSAATKSSGVSKKTLTKPATASEPASEPDPSTPPPEPPIAGLSGMQFWVIVVLIVCMIIIQVVFAKKQQTQLAVINENFITIHKNLK